MPNEIAPLLPPDPEKPGRYWLKQHAGPDVIGLWYPHGRYWRVEGWRTPAGPEDLHYCGYTLATRHRIPTPGELEAVYAAWDAIQARIARLEARLESSETDIGELSGLVRADDLLRDALGGGA